MAETRTAAAERTEEMAEQKAVAGQDTVAGQKGTAARREAVENQTPPARVSERNTRSWRERWDSWEGLGAGTIKLIAVLSMLIDHTAAGILGRYLNQAGIRTYLFAADPVRDAWLEQYGDLYFLYDFMRNVGRLAFPIYCFFLVEGLKYTRNQWKYLGRLVIFAFLSEIPFDLLFNNAVLEFQSQNVYFTLAVSLAVMIGLKELGQRLRLQGTSQAAGFLTMILGLAAVGAGCILTVFLKTDYSYRGVLCTVAIYLFSGSRIKQLLAGAVAFCWELPAAPLAFLPLALYKKKRGLKLKYFFYAFYPLHLLVLYLIAVCLGIGQLPAL